LTRGEGFDFTDGEKYLIFARGNSADSLVTGVCLPSDLLAKASQQSRCSIDWRNVPQKPGLALVDPDQLKDFGRRYTAAWCSQDASSVAAFFAENGSLQINGGAPSVGRPAIAARHRSS
jgi:hypothetical protein